MSIISYPYDVGFSFLALDEGFAADLNKRLNDRNLPAVLFLSSHEEHEDMDKVEKNALILAEQCRVVVVLYRDGWGKTPRTHKEETAIKNRVLLNGSNFLFFLNLDNSNSLPNWVLNPQSRSESTHPKMDGLVTLIQQKVKANGGLIGQETLHERIKRFQTSRSNVNKRKVFLTDPEALVEAVKELRTVIGKLKEIKEVIEDPSSHLNLTISERPSPRLMYQFGMNGYYLCFVSNPYFEQDLEKGTLKVVLYQEIDSKEDYQAIEFEKTFYRFAKDFMGNNGWSDFATGEGFLSSDELIEKWVRLFLDGLENRNGGEG